MLATEQNYSDLLEHFSKAPDLVADLETNGLRPFSGHRLCGVALEAGGVAAYFPYRHRDGGNLPIEKLDPVLDLLVSGVEITGHNWIRFDAQTVAMERDDLPAKLILSDAVPAVDTMLQAYLKDETEPSFKLENLAAKYKMTPGDPKAAEEELLAKLEARGFKGKEAKGHLWEMHASEVEPYACNDVVLTRGLREYYDIVLGSHKLLDIQADMCRYARVVARMERVGLKIDRERLERQMEETGRRAATWREEIESLSWKGINTNSPKQLQKWLGMTSTAREVLEKAQHPHAQLLSRYRKAAKAIGTYHLPILALTDSQGILHPQYNLTRDNRDHGGTLSGRLSCSNPNFQALPDVKRDVDKIYGVKECVIPRDPSRCFLAWDLERAEMWLGGSLCGERAIHDAYMDDLDLYDVMAEELGITRSQAKSLFLGLQYGMGKVLLAYKLRCSVEEATAWRDKFHRLYPAIRAKMQELCRLAEQQGWVPLWTGRRIHFDGERTSGFHAWNRCVQGGVAEILRVAMTRLETQLAKLDAEMVLQIHDELVVECPLAAAREVNTVVTVSLETFPSMDLPPRTSPRWGLSLGTLQEGMPV